MCIIALCPIIECLQDIGKKLTEITPRGVLAVFETLRSVLHSKQVNSRVQYMIEVMFAVRKDKFQVLYVKPELVCQV